MYIIFRKRVSEYLQLFKCVIIPAKKNDDYILNWLNKKIVAYL